MINYGTDKLKWRFFLYRIELWYLNGFGFGMSFDWSSQTGAGWRNGGWGGGGGGVDVGGRIGPVFVL